MPRNRLTTCAPVALACAAALTAFAVSASAAAPKKTPPRLPDLAKASWIWASPKAVRDGAVDGYFRKTFDLSAKPPGATVLVTADNGYDLYVNGSLVGGDAGYDGAYWRSVEKYDIASLLVAGENVLGVKGNNMGGAAGLVVAARIRLQDGTILELHTDATWRMHLLPETGWSTPEHDDANWRPATVLGPMGMAPWGRLAYPGPTSPGRGQRAATGRLVEAGPDFDWPAGIVFLRGKARTPGPQSIWRIRGSRAYLEHDAPVPAMLGSQLHRLVPARPDGRLRLLHDAGKGLIGSPRVSYDGKTVYFAMAPAGEAFFHVYRISADGSDLTALTKGPWNDYDPEPLPDGRIAFSSTRIGNREEYHGNVASSLFVMNADGAAIRPLTYHIVADREPRVTADGGIAFVRSDNFLQRAKVETQIHQVRPDGAGGVVILGADRGPVGYDRPRAAEHESRWLRQYGFGSIAPLPDGRIAAISATGLVASRGESVPEAIPAPFVPLDISPLPDGRLLCTVPGQAALGVLDPASGDMTRIYSSDVGGLHSVVYLGPRPKPAASVASHRPPSGQPPGEETGFLYCQNVFHTRQTQADLARVRAIRVYEGRPLALRSARHPYDHIGVEAVELGTVPLAPDGSFYVRVPADRALALQAVDAEGRAVVSELTWIYARPGERRSCIGCHAPRTVAPRMTADAAANRAPPLDLLGQGRPHRFRGNNAANGGVLNLQLDRFREAATIDLYSQPPITDHGADQPLPPGRPAEVKRLCEQLSAGAPDAKLSAARRLAIFRDPAAVGALLRVLHDPSSELRTGATLALATCGNRDAVPGLLKVLTDPDPLVAQAAHTALEHLTGHAPEFDAFSIDGRVRGIKAWQTWLERHDWSAIEAELVTRLADKDPVTVHLAIETLGHVGGDAAKAALRDYLAANPDGDLRTLMAAMRALGQLQDDSAVPLLTRILKTGRKSVKGGGSHEFGWHQKPIYLAATAAEALGRIATPEAEKALIEAFPTLGDFWYYTFRAADHDWLMGSHSSPLHYRIVEALDAIGSRDLAAIVPHVLRSVPIDSDRGILLENDGYETLTSRLVQRSGRAPAVIETCLAVLGDPDAEADEGLKAAVTASPPARSTKPLCPESRAAHVAGVVCLDRRFAPRLRAAFERYRATEPSRKRSWTCFFLARTLGKVRDRGSVDALLAAVEKDPTEVSQGLEMPPNVFLYKAMTPFHRAAAAYALGRIGDTRAAPALMKAVADFDNALDVRHSAAQALAMLCDPSHLAALEKLAADYPEVATRRILLRACRQAKARKTRVARGASTP